MLRRGNRALQCSFLLLLCISIFGQSPTANLVGRVQDQTGGGVTGATIFVRNAAVGETREVKSDENGEYTVTNLPPGNYRITVEKEGFRLLSSDQTVPNLTQLVADAG